MSKSATFKQSIRFQEWVMQVQEFNARPEGMSMTAWCKQKGIAPSTFATRLHKVQDVCLGQVTSDLPVLTSGTDITSPMPTAFVELPIPVTVSNAEPVLKTSAAVITCGKAKIEISDDVSEEFLIKMLGAINHA